jgi:trigger factor
MKHAVENIDPTRVKLTVEVDYDELKPSIDAAYKQISNQVTIPGFRKGKIPARIIEQRFGWGTIVEQAINSDLGRYYSQAMN